MTKLDPWKLGLVLAITMAVSYTVCAVLYASWPERGIEFLNDLFHGLDFRKFEMPAPFRISMFFFPFVVLVVWGFVVGTLFGWLHNLFHRGSARP